MCDLVEDGRFAIVADPVRKDKGAAEGTGQNLAVARIELEYPTAISDRMEHTKTDNSRRLFVVLAVILNLLSAVRLVSVAGRGRSGQRDRIPRLDAALRRLWHVAGAMGHLLDPIADKVFVLIEE